MGKKKGQYPAKEEWEERKHIIRRLYKDERKTLKQVMAIMERDYNFSAT